MKYVSEFKELNGKVFDTIDDCNAAETKIIESRNAIAEKEKEKSRLRKELAGEVETAEQELKKAYEDYDAARDVAAKILEESNQRILDLLKPAKEAIRDAEKKRVEAICRFNKECGPYQKTYTGDKAITEFNRISKQMDNLFGDMFGWALK